MSFFDALHVALASMLVHKGRTALTSLGIVIGTSAVIAMVSAADGVHYKLDDRMNSIGRNLILIRSGSHAQSTTVADLKPLKVEDADLIRKHCRHLVRGVAELQYIARTVTTGQRNWPTELLGTSPELQHVREWKIAHGRFFTHEEQRASASVCVIAETVRQKLFPDLDNVVGQTVRVDQQRLRIVGQLLPKGRNPKGDDQDNELFIPITTLQRKIAGEERINAILTAVRDENLTSHVVQEISRLLRESHRVKKGEEDFDVSSVEEMAQVGYVVTDTLKIVVAIVASLSLLVGGIGIMNIMLVSVTERTREIGLRMAVGATPFEVLLQFLLEAMVLGLLGGVIGISVGIGAAVALAHVMGWPVLISPFVVVGAFLVSAAVGVFFGIYPAWKASRLEPIDALHHE